MRLHKKIAIPLAALGLSVAAISPMTTPAFAQNGDGDDSTLLIVGGVTLLGAVLAFALAGGGNGDTPTSP